MGKDLEPGDPSRIGPYRLVGVLGSGGMGKVFLGRSAGGWPVAVKVIRADFAADPEFRARFRREVASARRVNGLYTALVVDADVDGPVPWLATAYVPGPSLADAVASRGPLPPPSLRILAAGLAEGLGAIHSADVVHRDLKPSNVLLADDGPRVIDFGISQAAETGRLTQAGLVVGSPGFMSPEQAVGKDVGSASDVFSLGGVLTFAATGHGPFGTGPTATLIYRVVHGPPMLDDVPAEIRAVVARCLAKEPGERPTSAEILAEFGDTEPAAGWLGETIVEKPPLHASAPPATATATAQAPAEGGTEPTVAAVSAVPGAAGAGPGQSGPVPTRRLDTDHQRPRIRTRRRMTWLAVAAVVVIAAVAVPLALTARPSSPGGGNPTTSPTTSPSPTTSAGPTVAGVYSDSQYGFQAPVAIAIGDGHVWVANYDGNSVTELDAGNGTQIQTLTGSQYGFSKPLAIAVDGTHVWVANSSGNSVTELNASNGDLVRIISGVNSFSRPNGIIADGARIWVTSKGPGSGSVTELNSSDGSVIQTLSGGSYSFDVPDALAVDGAHIWVANEGKDGAGGSVTEINSSDGSLVRVISGSAYGFDGPDGIAVDGGHVWVLNGNGDSVTELNSSRGGTLVRILSGVQYVFEQPSAIVADGAHIWITNSGEGGSPGRVTEIDAGTGALVSAIANPSYVAAAQSITVDGAHVWFTNAGLSSGDDGWVTELTTG